MVSNPPDPVAQDEALRRSLVAIRGLRRRLAEAESRSSEPIAIVGAACRLPGGASSPEALWTLLAAGTDATGDVPPDRWDAEALYDPDPDAAGRTYVRRGGFLTERPDLFDAGFFRISPVEAASLDPLQRLLLELAWEALERAGIPPVSLEGTDSGVFVGLSGSDYLTMLSRAPFDQIDGYRGTGTAACVASGRLSYFLGLHGPNVAIDSACSSGLVALVQAVQSLRAGQCRLALAGSSHLMLTPEPTIFLCRLKALSPDGRSRTFDAAANGYGRGEGGVMFVLKRLRDALADGDSVHAVIRGVAFNHDGRSSGLTVPNPTAQRMLIATALSDAGLRPEQIDYVETHGTGTPLGDPIELRVLADLLAKGRPGDRPLLLGSIKTSIGHLEAVAGLAGLLKVLLSMRHAALPPHLHVSEPTPHFDWAGQPLRLVTELTPWVGSGELRRGAVSAFGLSGTNAHVIVEEAPVRSETHRPRRPMEIIALSAKSQAAVRDLTARYLERLSSGGEQVLPDLGAASTVGRSHFSHRAFAVGGDAAAMERALQAVISAGDAAAVDIGGRDAARLAFLFTGQGAQYAGMARELWETAPRFRAVIERCAEIVRPHMDEALLPLLIDAGAGDRLRQTACAQPALFAFEVALTELWRSWGVEPAFVIGHSLGEYVAATVAGVMDLEQALPLVALRGRLMQGLPAGGRMAAVFAADARVRAAMEDLAGISIAAVNAPENVVISGRGSVVEEMLDRLRAQGVGSQELDVSHAFHSPLMDPILDQFEQAVAAVSLRPPQIPLVSNLTGELITADDATDPRRWRRHLRETVRFEHSVRTLLGGGARVFLEIGPRPTLCALAQTSTHDPGVRWLPSIRPSVPVWKQLLEGLGELYRAGLDPDWRGFARDHAGRRSDGPTYPFQRKRYWYTDREPAGAVTTTPIQLGRSSRHPLLGVALESPAVDGWAFQITLSPRAPRYLSEHRVQGHVVVPGAVYVEMVLAALREGPGWVQLHLSDVTFVAPLVLADGGVRCQVLISAVRHGRVTVRVVSAAAGHEPARWTTHATAVASQAVERVSARNELSALRATLSSPVAVTDLYERIAAHGVVHGDAFRTLKECHVGGTEALGQIALGDSVRRDVDRYILHPCALDAGFQLLASLASQPTDDDATWLPAGIDQIHVNGPSEAHGWIHCAIRRAESDATADQQVADLTFFDSAGQPDAAVVGFRWRRLRRPLSLAAAPDSAGICSLQWMEGPFAGQVPDDLAGVWLVLAERRQGVGVLLCRAIEARGGSCIVARQGPAFAHLEPDDFVVDPGSSSDWERLWAACVSSTDGRPLRGLIHLWSLERAESRDEGPVERVLDATAPITELARLGAMARMNDGLRIVTAGAAGPACGTTNGWEAGAALWGMLSVLRSEHPELTCRAIDLGPEASAVDLEQLLSHVFGTGSEERVVLDGGRPRVPRLEHRLAPAGSDRREVPGTGGYRVDVERRGTLGALRYLAAERPSPEPGQVVVRVGLTGLNFRDVLNVLGAYPGDPGPPGIEFVGTVTDVGVGVSRFVPGDSVIGIGSAAFASHVLVPEHAVAHAPRGLSSLEAVTIPLAFLTAEYGLMRLAGLKPGERVLIHAAAGGVGHAAVQLARARGAQVFATAGSDAKRAFLRRLGVQDVFDSRSLAFADGVRAATSGAGVDVVLNSLTGDLLRASLDLLGDGGRFLELGKTDLLDPTALARTHPGVSYIPYDLGTPLNELPDEFRSLFRDVIEQFEGNRLTPLPVRVFEAEEIVEAFRYMAQARHVGKVVVKAKEARLSDDALVRPDGCYLVTGATGGIGREIAGWLHRRGAGAIVLAARSEPGDEVKTWIESLRSGGSAVELVRGDVADASDARRMVERANASGRQLRGVFHCAGVVDDGLLETQTRARVARVVDPKVAGAWNLHEAIGDLDVDHFVLFSSVSGLMGGPGQAGYAAANAYLDALACYRSAQGLRALSIAWGAWGGSGMAARMSEQERRLLQRRGLGFLQPDQAIARMERLLADGVSYAVIADVDWPRTVTDARHPPSLLQHILADHVPHHAAGAEGSQTLAERLDHLQSGELRQEFERYLCVTLAGVLGLQANELAANAEIAQFGFDSLMAVELRNRIETNVGIVVPASALLASATVAAIAGELVTLYLSRTHGAAAPLAPVVRSTSERPFRLGLAQERIWLFQELEPQSTTYNLSHSMHIDGALDVPRLEAALRDLVEQQEVLRSVIDRDGDEVVVRQVPIPTPLVTLKDLGHVSPDARAETLREVVQEEQRRPFDLRHDVPLRVVLLRWNDSQYELVFLFHHVAVDGMSMFLFARELVARYRGDSLPALPVRFRDHAESERSRWDAAGGDALDFWRDYLAGAPLQLDLPMDRLRPADATYAGGAVLRSLGRPDAQRLLECIRNEGATLFMAVLAAYAACLHRQSGQRDIVVGTAVNGRNRPELGNVIGMFVNQIPIRLEVPAGATFRELLRQTRQTVLRAMGHQDDPFSRVLQALDVPRDRSRTPVFQTFVNVLPPGRNDADWSDGAVRFTTPVVHDAISLFDVQSKFDLTLYAHERDEEIHFALVFNRSLYDDRRMESFLDLVQQMLAQGLQRPAEPLDVVCAPPAPRLGAVAASAGDVSIVEAFVDVAGRFGSEAAVTDAAGAITYRELRDAAAAVSRTVVRSVPPERPGPIGVFVPHDARLAQALIGVLGSGRPYVPIDPRYPMERVVDMAVDAALAGVLTVSQLVDRARSMLGSGMPIVDMDDVIHVDLTPLPSPSPDASAYLLFTSGSTGRPRAVVQSQRNLLHQARRYAAVLDLRPADRLALLASVSFDASLMDLFGAWSVGAAVEPIDARSVDLAMLPALLAARRLTVLHVTPSVLRTLASVAPHAEYPSIRTVVLGGEAVRLEDVIYFDERFRPDARLLNLYGASEHSFSHGWYVDRQSRSIEVPIGYPVGDVESLLLDPDGNVDPVRGELTIRSRQGALGYWNAPDEDARRFAPDPERPGETLYRTGDVVRRRPDGAYVFLHRTDDQLKIRGYRVEPLEVESVLARHPGVSEVAVHGRSGPDSLPVLSACVVFRQLETANTAELLRWCRERLPEYMVPSRWVIVDRLPRTPSGKLARGALPALEDLSTGASVEDFRTPTEEIVAGIFSEVLGRPQLPGRHDDFFELGGHSLLAAQVIARVRTYFGVDVPLRVMFESPSVTEFGQWLDAVSWAATPAGSRERLPDGERVDIEI